VSNYRIVEGHFIVYVELWPLTHAKKLPFLFTKTFTGSDLQRSVFQHWNAHILVAKELRQSTTSYIIAVLNKKFKSVKYSYILDSVQKALSATWTLHYNGDTFKFSATLHRHIEYHDVCNGNLGTDFIEMEPYAGEPLERDEVVDGKQYEYIMFKTQWNEWVEFHNQGSILITKTSFCDLVELEKTEFTASVGQITLTAFNKTLAPGEFHRVVGVDGDIKPRICLEDLHPLDNRAFEIDDIRGLIIGLYIFYQCVVFV